MFDSLSGRLERLSTSLRSRGRLSDADLAEALGEVRTALLEADVELSVVRAFLDAVANDKPCPVTGEDGLQDLIIGLAAKKSIAENRPVKISEIG